MAKKPKKKTDKDSLEAIDVSITRDELEEDNTKEDKNEDEDSFIKILNEVIDSVFKDTDD